MTETTPSQVLIAGGGVSALETLMALRDLAGERVAITLIAPETTFTYRPMKVAEPFNQGHAHEYGLTEIARDHGARFIHDSVAEVTYVAGMDAARRDGRLSPWTPRSSTRAAGQTAGSAPSSVTPEWGPWRYTNLEQNSPQERVCKRCHEAERTRYTLRYGALNAEAHRERLLRVRGERSVPSRSLPRSTCTLVRMARGDVAARMAA